MPYGVFETVDVDKLCNKVGSVDAIKLRDKCHSTIASIKEFEINLGINVKLLFDRNVL